MPGFIIAQDFNNEFVSVEYQGQLFNYLPGHYILKIRDFQNLQEVKNQLQRNGFTLGPNIGLNYYAISGINRTFDELYLLNSSSFRDFGELMPVTEIRTDYIPNDDLFLGDPSMYDSYYGAYNSPGQWYLKNSASNPLANSIIGADSKVWQAWDISTGSEDIVIVVFDTGISTDSTGVLNHPDLSNSNRIIKGRRYLYTNNPNDPWGSDTLNVSEGFNQSNQPHGTWMTGIIGAEANNHFGISGVAPTAKLLIMKVMSDNGFGDPYSLPKAMDFVVNYQLSNPHKRIIINMSISGYDQVMSQNIADLASDHNILIVGSAGNTNSDNSNCNFIATYPGAIASSASNVISTSASNHYDAIVFNARCANTTGQVTIVAPAGTSGGPDYCNFDCSAITTSPIQHSIVNQMHTKTDYFAFAGKSSGAAAHASGVSALIWSANPELIPSEIKQLIIDTADKVPGMGGQNYHNRYGYGRINALKAVYRAHRMRVEEEMASYKSLDESATATNQGRRIVHDGSSSHIVFESGGEIVYFKRLSNGSLSTPILLSQLQDTLIGRNGKPSITLSGSTVHVVWQKKRYGYDVYDIVHRYSTNGGSSWSSEVYAKESLAQTWDPIPALAGSVVSWSPHLMLTYRGPDGIHALVYNFSTNLFGPYATGNSLMLADTLATSPALAASYYGSNNKQHIAWSDNGASIRYSMFTASSGTWSTPVNLSSIVSGSASHLTPSISGNINGNIHLVWHRSTGSGQYQNIIYHRRKHSSDGTWPNQYSATYYQYQGTPSIKSVNSTEAMLAWSQLVPSTHCTYKQPYNSNGQWGNMTQLSCGGARYPSVSLYGENRAVWTSGTVLPSDIVVSSSALKDQAPKEPTYIRSISWKSDQSSQRIELLLASPLLVVDGVEHSLPWVQVHPDTIISNLNLGDYLRPDLSTVDVDALGRGNIRFRAHISAQIPRDLDGLDLNVFNNGQAVHSHSMDFNGDKSSMTLFLDLPLGSVKKDDSVFIRPSTDSMFDLALGHHTFEPDGWGRWTGAETDAIHEIAEYQVESPTKFSIDTYPNPFNPTTQIRFTLPESGVTNLKIYDILGRQVAVIVNGLLAAGEHQFTFDATGLPSGLYLYKIESGGQALSGKMLLVK